MKKMKLNIQLFGSTNSTTHYELSQYIGTDKPTYLVDYNQDMSKIDEGIYDAKSEADNNSASIGTLSNLITGDKSSLVNAINEVETKANTIGNLSNLTTIDKTNVVDAVNEVNGKTNTIGDLVNLTTTAKSDLVAAVNEVNGKTNAIGDLVNLTTTDKSSLVAAVNEVDGDVGILSNLTTTDKSSLVAAINEIEGQELGITGKILWSNPNPTATFLPQTITLNSDDYDELTFFYKKTNNENKLDSIQIIKGFGTDLEHIDGGVSFFRSVGYVSDTSYQFYDGKLLLPNSSSPSIDNTRCIPLYIIGYKTGLLN